MAKRDIKYNKVFYGRKKIYVEYSNMNDSQMGIYKSNTPRVDGPRIIIRDAFDENGINGAVLAFKMLEKRQPGVYTWEMIEEWLKQDRNYVPKTTNKNSNNGVNKIKGDKCGHTL